MYYIKEKYSIIFTSTYNKMLKCYHHLDQQWNIFLRKFGIKIQCKWMKNISIWLEKYKDYKNSY